MNTESNEGKRPRGRPPMADRSAVSTARLNLRLTQEERERYHRAAKAAGMTLTGWLTALADAAAPKQCVAANEEDATACGTGD